MERNNGRETRTEAFLVRLRPREMERLRAGAAARRITISELIREAALEAAREAILGER